MLYLFICDLPLQIYFADLELSINLISKEFNSPFRPVEYRVILGIMIRGPFITSHYQETKN